MRRLLRVSLAVAKVGKGTEKDELSWLSKSYCFRKGVVFCRSEWVTSKVWGNSQSRSVKEWKQWGLEGRREVSGAGVDSGFPSLTIGTPITHVQRPTVRLAQGRRATWQGAKQPFGSSSFPFAQRPAWSGEDGKNSSIFELVEYLSSSLEVVPAGTINWQFQSSLVLLHFSKQSEVLKRN